MSWIEEEEKLLRVQEKFQREPMESIKCFFLFMNQNKYIEQITDEIIDLQCGKIPRDRVLKIVEEKKCLKPGVRYAFLDSWIFLVDLEPENIQSIEPSSPQFFKTMPFVSDITIAQSIFIFHPLNSLFFLFKRRKSSLKMGTNKSKKKVMFSLPPLKKHTRRII